MTIYPYLREAIATITAKVFGEPIHILIVQRGEIAVEVEEASPARPSWLGV